MGRLIFLLLIVLTAVLLWKAFGPSTWKRGNAARPQALPPKGPDDDPDFLWNIQKERFKQRRAAEQERERRAPGASPRPAEPTPPTPATPNTPDQTPPRDANHPQRPTHPEGDEYPDADSGPNPGTDSGPDADSGPNPGTDPRA